MVSLAKRYIKTTLDLTIREGQNQILLANLSERRKKGKREDVISYVIS